MPSRGVAERVPLHGTPRRAFPTASESIENRSLILSGWKPDLLGGRIGVDEKPAADVIHPARPGPSAGQRH